VRRQEVNIAVGGADTANVSYKLVPPNNTFSSACLLIVNFHASGTAGEGIVPTNTPAVDKAVAGLFISNLQ
jgi:hypothetical protein